MGCLYLLADVSKAAVNMGVQGTVEVLAVNSWVYT